MNFLLDMKTIFISLIVGHLFSAVLISAYWRHDMKNRTVSVYLCAKCVQAVAWLCLVIRGGIPDVLTISLSNSFLFFGASLEMIAVLGLQNALHRRTKRLYCVLTAANIIGFHLILLFHNVESVRIVFASIGTAAIIVFPAYKMIRNNSSSLLMKTVGYLYMLVVATSTGRAAAAVLSDQTMSFFTPGIYQTLSFLALYLVMITGNTGFVLLLKEKADQELLHMANYDDLTETLKRKIFIARARQYLASYAKKRRPVSLLLFDVDQFKTINDTYGHDAGDKVLQDLTERIKQLLDADDLFGRYGGDEFAILLPGKDEKEALEKAERIRKSVDRAANEGLPVKYTISLGVLTVIPNPYTQFEALYSLCDKALYSAKRNGRNAVFRGDVV